MTPTDTDTELSAAVRTGALNKTAVAQIHAPTLSMWVVDTPEPAIASTDGPRVFVQTFDSVDDAIRAFANEIHEALDAYPGEAFIDRPFTWADAMSRAIEPLDRAALAHNLLAQHDDPALRDVRNTAIRDAIDNGTAVTALAAALGVSRPTIYSFAGDLGSDQ